MQVRAQAADERVEHASLDHGGPQIDRTSGLRSAVGEVEARDPVLDGDGDGKLHRLVDHDAVAVENGIASYDRKSTRLNSSHANISYAVFCLEKKKTSH